MIQLNEPNVEYREEKPCVYIPIRVPMKEWNKTTVLIGEVMAWIGRKGLESGGAPFYRYREIGDMEKTFSLEVGAPVTQPVEGDGKVLGGTIPSGQYVTLMHNGHPDSLVYSLRHIENWAKDQGLEWENMMDGEKEVWGGRFEFYLTDPAQVPDPNKWSIELAYLIK